MDQTHTRAIKALEQFVVLAETTAHPSPRFVADLISRATSAPSTYCFAKLLVTPAVQSLNGPDVPAEQKEYYKLLQIFAWGTLQDYHDSSDVPSLNEQQTEKLRLLTLLTLCTSPGFTPTYSALQTALSLPTPRALEELVIKAIYGGLINARLSPSSSPPSVRIDSVAPIRDPPPGSVASMLKLLEQWQSRCASVANDITTEIARINTAALQRKKDEIERVDLLAQAVAQATEDAKNGNLQQTTDVAGLTGKGGKMSVRTGKGKAPAGISTAFSAVVGSAGNKRPSTEQEEESSDEESRMDLDEGYTGARHAKRLLGSNKRG